MDLQKMFDTVARHLLTQNKKCLNDGDECQYHADGNLRCAVGCLIPDALYDVRIEGQAIDSLLSHAKGPLGEFLTELAPTEAHEKLLKDLQWLHDEDLEDEWPERLKLLAKKHGLSDGVLEPKSDPVHA